MTGWLIRKFFDQTIHGVSVPIGERVNSEERSYGRDGCGSLIGERTIPK